MTPNLGVSTLNPPDVCALLQLAASLHDVPMIDAITARLASEGYVRPRGDMSMLTELQAQCDRVRRAGA